MFFNISHITKKGKSDGKTTLNQRLMPDLHASIASFEYMINSIINSAQKKLINNNENVFFLCNLKYKKSNNIRNIKNNLPCDVLINYIVLLKYENDAFEI